MFKPAVYDRGAMALQALRVAVGDKDFFTALRTWTTQRRAGNGSIADFLALIQRLSGKNVVATCRAVATRAPRTTDSHTQQIRNNHPATKPPQ